MIMFTAFAQFIQPSFEFIATQLFIVLAFPFIPSQRVFWLYMGTSIILAFYVYHVSSRSLPAHKSSFRSFIRFLFPKDIWDNPSAWLDVRYFFFHQMFRVFIYGAFFTGVLNLIFQIVTGGPNLIDASASTNRPNTTDIAISTAYMFALIAIGDFVAYVLHYLQHKVPFLWEFHRVHHSLEVMHPLSNYREHPIDNIVYAAGTGAAYGLLMGLASRNYSWRPSDLREASGSGRVDGGFRGGFSEQGWGLIFGASPAARAAWFRGLGR